MPRERDDLAQPIKKGPLALAYCPAATDRRNLSALVPHGFTKIPPTYLLRHLDEIGSRAKAVLFPEAEEKTISAAGSYWRMLSSSPRIGACATASSQIFSPRIKG
jgi:hypothetical protein